MRVAVALIALAVAVIGWLRPDDVPLGLTIAMVSLLVLAAVVQVLIERRKAKEDAKQRYGGVLEPKTKALKLLLSPFKTWLSSNEEALPKLELGDSGSVLVWHGPQGQAIFKFFDDNSLTITTDSGEVEVSTLIRGQDGSVVAELVKNEWRVNPHKSFDRNYGDGALEVKDGRGDIVLQVRLAEDRIQFQGKFYDSSGRAVGLGSMGGPQGKHGVIEITGSEHPRLDLSIEPIFKYPSDLHLGELR